MRCEGRLELFLCGREGKIPNVDSSSRNRRSLILLLRPSVLIRITDGDLAIPNLSAVHEWNGDITFCEIAIGDEAEAAARTRGLVGHDDGIDDPTVGLERGTELLRRHASIQSTHEESTAPGALSSSTTTAAFSGESEMVARAPVGAVVLDGPCTSC